MDNVSKPEIESEQQKAAWDTWLQNEIKQVREDIQSSTDSFDKSMLTVSSGALGVSLAFIKEIVPLPQASWLPVLQASWVAFAVCIAATVISFRVSRANLKTHERFVRKVHAERKQGLSNRKTKLLNFCTEAATYFFLVGLAATVLFVIKNVRDFHMSNDTKGGQPIQTKVVIPEFGKGRQPMEMMPTPTSVPTIPAPAQSSVGNAPNAAPAEAPCQPIKNN
jgi:hypothetical protein